MGSVYYFSEKVKFQLPNSRKTSNWVKRVITKEGKNLKSLNVIFCSDRYLSQINERFLNHKTLTDIITFDYSEVDSLIEGDVFISIPRVRENAKKFKQDPDSELHRVIIHGVLHLIGYSDKTVSQKSKMREKEDAYLSLRIEG